MPYVGRLKEGTRPTISLEAIELEARANGPEQSIRRVVQNVADVFCAKLLQPCAFGCVLGGCDSDDARVYRTRRHAYFHLFEQRRVGHDDCPRRGYAGSFEDLLPARIAKNSRDAAIAQFLQRVELVADHARAQTAFRAA